MRSTTNHCTAPKNASVWIVKDVLGRKSEFRATGPLFSPCSDGQGGEQPFNPSFSKVRRTWRLSTDAIRPGKEPLTHWHAQISLLHLLYCFTPSSQTPKIPRQTYQNLGTDQEISDHMLDDLFTTRRAAARDLHPRSSRCSSSWKSHRI